MKRPDRFPGYPACLAPLTTNGSQWARVPMKPVRSADMSSLPKADVDTVHHGYGMQRRVIKRPDKFPGHPARLASLSAHGLQSACAAIKTVRSAASGPERMIE